MFSNVVCNGVIVLIRNTPGDQLVVKTNKNNNKQTKKKQTKIIGDNWPGAMGRSNRKEYSYLALVYG